MGGFASRQTVTAGSSVHLAALAVREKAIKVAAQMLDELPANLTIEDGVIHMPGKPSSGVPLADVAMRLRGLPGYAFPEGAEAGLEATFHFRVDQLAYSNAFHVCEVEVDIETGFIRLMRYIAMHDSGKLINPMMVEGQIHGGIVHGIGNAMFEYMPYDEYGQPTTTTLADYLLPTATDIPHIEVLLHESPSPVNPLGVKGAGESGVLPVASSIASAIEDALAGYGIHIDEVPITPLRLLDLINNAYVM